MKYKPSLNYSVPIKVVGLVIQQEKVFKKKQKLDDTIKIYISAD